MKRDLLTNLLIGLLVLGALTSATLSLAYVQYMRKLRSLQMEASIANRNFTMFQQLAAEAVQYSNTNAAMNKILEEVGINKNKPPSDPGAAPLPKP